MTDPRCERCRGSGVIGVKADRYGFAARSAIEAPGPVPDDVRGWIERDCPDCHGEGKIWMDDGEDE